MWTWNTKNLKANTEVSEVAEMKQRRRCEEVGPGMMSVSGRGGVKAHESRGGGTESQGDGN